MLLRWRAPAANGSRITRYVVQVKRAKTFATIAVRWSKPAKAWVWSGGRRGTVPVFRVAAVNGVGQGSWSALRSVRVR